MPDDDRQEIIDEVILGTGEFPESALENIMGFKEASWAN